MKLHRPYIFCGAHDGTHYHYHYHESALRGTVVGMENEQMGLGTDDANGS
jgi:hypothetical protein